MTEHKHDLSYPEPWSISDGLRPTLEKLNLQDNVGQLKDEGYTIVDEAYDANFCDELRLAIIEETESQKGSYFDIKSTEGQTAYQLLGTRDIFAQALLNPQLMAIAEYLCGGDFQLSQLSGSVRFEGASAMGLHIDAQWVPPTPYNPMFTACLALEDLEIGSGPTRVVPGSHLEKRNPEPEEVENCSEGIPMLSKKGGFSVWPGYTWHSNYARTIPGERVMLHMTFCRLAYRGVEDYSHVSDEYLANFPPEIATMLGRNSWFGLASRNSGQCVMDHYLRTWESARR